MAQAFHRANDADEGSNFRIWAEKLKFTDEWYRERGRKNADDAVSDMLGDYAFLVDCLDCLHGCVLDIGGGSGIVARFLPPDGTLTVVDPSTVWREDDWQALSAKLRKGRPVEFVEGVGEKLPFESSVFDAGVAIYSLNHARDPARCVGEIARVVRPGGKAVVVLEDMEPTWGDLAGQPARWLKARCHGERLPTGWAARPEVPNYRASVLAKMAGRRWPLEPDHCEIRERAFRGWLNPWFEVRRRSWRGHYLTFELDRRCTEFAN